MRTTTVTLAGREYTVQALPIRKSREWRAQFEGLVGQALSAVQALSSMALQEFDNPKELITQFGGFLSANATGLGKALFGGLDLIADALFAYSPELAKDRKRIESEADDEELLRAFMEVAKLAFPFGALMATASRSGQPKPETSPSSPSPSGESGTTS